MSKDTISSDRFAAMAFIAAGSAEAIKPVAHPIHPEWPGDMFSKDEIKQRTQDAIIKASQTVAERQAWEMNLKLRLAAETLSDNPTVRAEQIAQRGGAMYKSRIERSTPQAIKQLPPFELIDWANSGSRPLRRKVAVAAGAAALLAVTIVAGYFSESTPNRPVKNNPQVTTSISSR